MFENNLMDSKTNQRSVSGGAEDPSTKELNAFVQGLLNQMQARFEDMSNNIINRVD